MCQSSLRMEAALKQGDPGRVALELERFDSVMEQTLDAIAAQRTASGEVLA